MRRLRTGRQWRRPGGAVTSKPLAEAVRIRGAVPSPVPRRSRSECRRALEAGAKGQALQECVGDPGWPRPVHRSSAEEARLSEETQESWPQCPARPDDHRLPAGALRFPEEQLASRVSKARVDWM